MFGSKSRKEIKDERDENTFNAFFRVEPFTSEKGMGKGMTTPPGWGCSIKLPEYDSVSRGMLTKGVATAAFGLIGFAMTSGSKQIQKEIDTRMIITEKGVKFYRAAENGGDLKIPWNEILKVEIDLNRNYGLIFVFEDNSTLTISFSSDKLFVTPTVLNKIANYINSRACGHVEEGW